MVQQDRKRGDRKRPQATAIAQGQDAFPIARVRGTMEKTPCAAYLAPPRGRQVPMLVRA
jgi:hypothetical protein